MDQATKARDKLNYSRIMVEVHMKQELPEVISFCNEHGDMVEQQIEYEWRPIVCKKCAGLGHIEEECRKGAGRRTWVPKQKRVVDHEGFQHVGTQKTGQQPKNERHVQQTLENMVLVHNPFNPLLDDAEDNNKENDHCIADIEVPGASIDREIDKVVNMEGGVNGEGLVTPLPNG